MQTAIVILNWNGKSCLAKYLSSVVKYSSGDGIKIYVADNCSTDGSVDFMISEYPDIDLIRLDDNYGFAGGYNRALSGIKADIYILLNSDVRVTENWITPLLEAFREKPEMGACMPKICSEKFSGYFEYAGASGGYIDYLGYPFCRGRLFNEIEKDNGQYDTPVDVFWASGAALAVRSSVFERLRGLDDKFFAHMEEIDFCWRLKNLGFTISCIPSSVIYHEGGATLESGSPFKVYLNFRNNLLMLYKNLPFNKFRRILYLRMFMDGIAALKYLLSGSPEYVKSIWKAHKDYRKLLPEYRKIRSMAPVPENFPSCTYKKSIVWKFFIHGVKKFSQLNSNDFITFEAKQ